MFCCNFPLFYTLFPISFHSFFEERIIIIKNVGTLRENGNLTIQRMGKINELKVSFKAMKIKLLLSVKSPLLCQIKLSRNF